MNSIAESESEKSQPLPLVSVIVITYNSAKYVEETLDSIKNQNYTNIELIVSDDFSIDETVAKVRIWIGKHRQRFSCCELVTSTRNKGIPGNCNQGLYFAKGEWVKYIAGDDYLTPDCITIFLASALQNPGASCFVSDMYVMTNGVINKKYQILTSRLPSDANIQLDNLLRYKSLPGAALFFKREILLRIGGYDERFPGLEDYPLQIKLVRAGFWFIAVNRPTVIYRIHGESITQAPSSFFLNSVKAHFNEVVMPLIVKRRLYRLQWHFLLSKKMEGLDPGFWRSMYSMLIRMTDTIYWENKFLGFRQIPKFLQVLIIDIPPIGLDKVLGKVCKSQPHDGVI